MKIAARIILIALAAAFAMSSCRGSSGQPSATNANPYAEAAEAVTSYEGTEILAHAADSTREVLMETETFAIKGADTLRLDRYFLSGMERADSPVVVFVFGGGFRFGERYSEMFVPYFEFLASHGCTVASIDYRTMLGRITFDGRPSPVDFMNILQSAIDTAVVDLYDATRYIAQQREAWGIENCHQRLKRRSHHRPAGRCRSIRSRPSPGLRPPRKDLPSSTTSGTILDGFSLSTSD